MNNEHTLPGDNAVILGRVSGLFGVRGWVKVFSFTEPRENLLTFKQVWLKQDGQWQGPLALQGQRHGKSVVALLGETADRDAAAELMGAEIGIPADGLPDPGKGHYYFRDLEGCEVKHSDGRSLGVVDYVLETGANDVLVIRGDKEILIPFVTDEVILGVDLDKRVIHVDWEWD